MQIFGGKKSEKFQFTLDHDLPLLIFNSCCCIMKTCQTIFYFAFTTNFTKHPSNPRNKIGENIKMSTHTHIFIHLKWMWGGVAIEEEWIEPRYRYESIFRVISYLCDVLICTIYKRHWNCRKLKVHYSTFGPPSSDTMPSSRFCSTINIRIQRRCRAATQMRKEQSRAREWERFIRSNSHSENQVLKSQ